MIRRGGACKASKESIVQLLPRALKSVFGAIESSSESTAAHLLCVEASERGVTKLSFEPVINGWWMVVVGRGGEVA